MKTRLPVAPVSEPPYNTRVSDLPPPPCDPRLSPPRCVAFLFDLDGTLIHAPLDFPGMKRAVLEIAATFGLDPEPLRALDILGVIDAAEAALTARSHSPEAPPPSEVSDLRRQSEAALTRYELDAANRVEELPGAAETLTELRKRGYRIAIVTRNCQLAVTRALERLPLIHDIRLTRNDVSRVKPHPDHLREAARQLGVPCGGCVMVGDHPMDIQAGRAAGMMTIGVGTRDPSPAAFDSCPPDLLLPSVADLLDRMRKSPLSGAP